jgi:hypothetical protein
MESGTFQMRSHRFAELMMDVFPSNSFLLRQSLYFEDKTGPDELIMYHFAKVEGFRCPECLTTIMAG